MSIINEALKKISEDKKDKSFSYNKAPATFVATEYAPITDQLNKKRWIFIGAVGALFAAIIFYLFIVISFKEVIPASKSGVTSNAVASNRALSDFSLKGIIYTSSEPQALINNDLVSVGDEINGIIVKDILPQKVVLQKGKKTFEMAIE